ncbi:MAG TPA: GAF domain-containing protein [Leptolyngbyaceae cyanobacterium]
MNIKNEAREIIQSIDRQGLLNRMTNRIRQSLELSEILAATVHEIRDFLSTDRVMVYRFNADNSGEVIAESINEFRLPTLKGLNFPADDIPAYAREQFVKARQRSIVDVENQRIGLSCLDCPETGEPLAVDIRYRPVDPCHIEYLKAMGVKSSLVVPILNYDIGSQQSNPKLWGLLVSHNAQSRPISEEELQVVQQVADQVSIAIAQSNLLSFARHQAQREATINRIATLLHAQPTIQLQSALEETVAVFQGAGGRIYINKRDQNTGVETPFNSQVYTCGEQLNLALIKNERGDEIDELDMFQTCSLFADKNGGNYSHKSQYKLCAIADIYQHPNYQILAPAFAGNKIRGLIVIPLEYRRQLLGYLTILRHEINTETLWAGHFDPDGRQLYPRRSFEAWKQLKNGQAREWTAEEIELAQALGNHFAMAVQQFQLYQQVLHLNNDLEKQVENRTAELQKSLNSARLLKQVTDEIRSTLDSKTILQTIVREVRNLLDTDRVIIYQFTKQWYGNVVVESVKSNCVSILGFEGPENCFPQEIAELYIQGRVRPVDDIYNADLAPCHQKFLENIQVRANLVVPIRMGTVLWGLLIAHQCDRPRFWQTDELDLLQQLASQAAIAIQQAELYQKTRDAATQELAKAQQLAKALDELQQAQSKLIQTEKMSSLGQLVAGVAHEINNPVNFIYGNLSHASQYIEDLLQLIELYQKCYENPHPTIQEKAEEIDLDFLLDDLPKLLNSMKIGADRIRQLVLSLRNFSRLDQSERKPVDIHEGIESSLLILQHRLKPKTGYPAIQIIKNYSKLPLIECYAGQLNQVFMNLLSNAIDALEQRDHQRTISEIKNQPSQITIQTQLLADMQGDRPWIGIKIADNGTGIPKEIQHRIFDPFFTTKDIGKGTGLGLAISYQILVEKHGGNLKCLSHPGQGTEFLIEIPCKPIIKINSEAKIQEPEYSE